MAKFIQLTTRKIRNLSLGFEEERKFKIDLNVDHILLIRPHATDSSNCVIFVNGICSALTDYTEIYDDFYEDADDVAKVNKKREDVRSTKSSMITVEESYEQVREMLY